MKDILTAKVSDVEDDELCEIVTAPDDPAADEMIKEIEKNVDLNITFDRNPSFVKPCSFPFRYNNILYYACTNITRNGTTTGLGSLESPFHLCAVEKDLDYHPTHMGFCNTNYRCPIQCTYSTFPL